MIPWGKVYKQLSLAYGWTAAEINKMTLYQIALYAGAVVPELGTIELDGDVTQEQIDAMMPRMARRQMNPFGIG